MKPLWLVFSVVCVAIYVALSVWGYGSWAGYFANPARTGLVFVILGLTVAALFADTSGLGAGVREDRSNRWVLIPLVGLGLVLMWLPAYMDAHNIWVWGGEPMRWFGLVLCAAGGIVRLVPVFELGRRFSGLVAIQEGHTLKTDGWYSIIRHPSYLGLLTCSLGWALVFRCVAVGLVIVAIMTAAIVARMNSEEKLLADQFGDEYAAYRKRTWRLIPWVY